MTTIALRDGVIAADSLATDDACGLHVYKLARLPGGDVAGAAGELSEVALALAWLMNGCKGDAPAIASSCVLFTKDGIPHIASAGWPGMRLKDYAAIGSGAQGAMVAMKLGHTAEQAVRLVAGIDIATGGEVDTLKVKRKRK